ncbi:hypothetical protein HMPREF1214_00479 [Bacteroides sp. HPS0048]|nr:hypothetical protein HMPREF1214_00479 [Bacteroides sp. HPS0048]
MHNTMRNRYIINTWIVLLFVNLVLLGCKDEIPQYVSMNTPQKQIVVGEQFKFELIVQGGGDISEPVIWSIYCDGREASNYATIDQNGVVKAITESAENGVSFNLTVRGELSNGRYALAKVTTEKRNMKEEELSFATTDIYMASNGEDSVELKISEKFIQYFPDIKVTTDKPDLIIPTLKLNKEKGSKVFLKTNADREETAVVTVTAGDESASFNVHIGQNLYLSFDEIVTGLGNVTTVDQASFSFLVNSSEPDTIPVHLFAIPDDETHLSKIKFNVRAEGGSPVLLVKGHKRVSATLLYVFVETGSQEGSTDVVIEALGKKVTASVSVLDKDLLEVKKIKFKKTEMVVTTNISLARDIVVDPVSILVHWPVQWSTSDENIAIIDNGKTNAGQMTFKQAGTVQVTGRVKDKEAVCTVTALLNVYNLKLSQEQKQYLVGETDTWVPIVDSNFGVGNRLEWISSNPEVATVIDGKVTTLSAGTTTIKVSITDDGDGVNENTMKTFVAEKTLTVTESSITDVTFNGNYRYFAEPTGAGVTVMVYDITDENVSYTFFLDYREGEERELNNKRYTVGQEILASSKVSFDAEGETLNLSSGTIDVTDGKALFNLTVQKGALKVNIIGTATLDE